MALGTGSVAMAPLLEQMEAHAAGRSDGFPRRFVFVVKSSGLTPNGIRPEGIEIGNGDTLLDLNLKDHKLHRSMASLEPFKNEIALIHPTIASI